MSLKEVERVIEIETSKYASSDEGSFVALAPDTAVVVKMSATCLG